MNDSSTATSIFETYKGLASLTAGPDRQSDAVLLGITTGGAKVSRSWDRLKTSKLDDAELRTANLPPLVEPYLPWTPKAQDRGRITSSQKWTGYVQAVGNDTFTAVVSDETNSRNPMEEMELSIDDVSQSDHPLLAIGAAFYLTMGYIDHPDGQRDRFSTLRFARQPRLSQSELDRILREATRLAEKLERD